MGIYGVTQIETNYSSIWYLRKSSYQSIFYSTLKKYFPDSGERVHIYVGDIKYWEHLEAMDDIYWVMANSSYIRNGTVSYWFHDFYGAYCLEDGNAAGSGGDDFWSENLDDSFFDDESSSLTTTDCSDGRLYVVLRTLIA